MRRNCNACRRPYEAQRSTSKFCSESCRKKASRGTQNRRIAAISSEKTAEAAGVTRERVRLELEAAGRADTYLGAAALALADRIDQSTAVMGFAALVKELRATMDAALAGAAKAADPLEEIKERARRLRAVK